MANLVTYAKQFWQDAKTAITAARLNNMEKGISDCATQINKLGDSVSRSSLSTVAFSYKVENGHCQIRFTDCNLTLFFSSKEIGIWDSTTLTTLWSQQFGK